MPRAAYAADAETVEIGTAQDFADFAERVNAGEWDLDAVLTADIDMAGTEWEPVGWGAGLMLVDDEIVTTGYAGTFDGNGHVISGIDLDDSTMGGSGTDAVAVFSIVHGATIRDVGVEGSLKAAHEWKAGGLVGEAYGTVAIERCWSDVDIAVGEPTYAQGVIHVGGIIGRITNATGTSVIASCANYGDIHLPDGYDHPAGGIVGSYTSAVVSDCLQAGAIEAGSLGEAADVGPIIGWWDYEETVRVENCCYLENSSPVDNEYGIALSADDMALGEAAWLLNGERLGGAWRQNLGANGDACPVLDATHQHVVKNADGTYGNAPVAGDFIIEGAQSGDGFSWDEGGHVLTIKKSGLAVSMVDNPANASTEIEGATTDRIVVEEIGTEDEPATLTLRDVKIEHTKGHDAPLAVDGGAHLTLDIVGENLLKVIDVGAGKWKTMGAPGLDFSDGSGMEASKGGRLTVTSSTGGSLEAYGGCYMPGVGSNWKPGDYSGYAGSMVFSGDVAVRATGGSDAVGIGATTDGEVKGIVIKDDAVVNATGSGTGAGIGNRECFNGIGGVELSIEGGYVNAIKGEDAESALGHGNGSRDIASISITGGKFAEGAYDADAGTIYGWEPAEGYAVRAISEEHDGVTYTAEVIPFDEATGDFEVRTEGGGYPEYGKDVTYEDGVLTIKGSGLTVSMKDKLQHPAGTEGDAAMRTADCIKVETIGTKDEPAALAIDGARIESARNLVAPIDVDGAAHLELELEGENVLVSSSYAPGLMFSDADWFSGAGDGSARKGGSLTITSATGGGLDARGSGGMPGIGSGPSSTGGTHPLRNLTIAGAAVVQATGGKDAAGIGAPDFAAVENLVIKDDACVTAQGIGDAPGIGNSRSQKNIPVSVTIEGGYVDARPGEGVDIPIGSTQGKVGGEEDIYNGNATITITGGAFADTSWSADAADSDKSVYGVELGESYAAAANNDDDAVLREAYPVRVYERRAGYIEIAKSPDSLVYEGQPIDMSDEFMLVHNVPTITSGDIEWSYRLVSAGEDAPWTEGFPADAGEYEIRAGFSSFSANGIYYGTSYDTAKVTIAPKTVNLNVDSDDESASKVYDGTADFEGVKLVVLGAVEGDDVSATADGYAFAPDASWDKPDANAGEKRFHKTSVTLSGEDAGNYEVATMGVEGLSITPAPLSVTVDAAHVSYGKDAPAFTASAEGWVSDTEREALSGVLNEALDFSCDYEKGDVAGEYPVTLSWKDGTAPSALSNYAVTLDGGVLEVVQTEAANILFEVLGPDGEDSREFTYGDVITVRMTLYPTKSAANALSADAEPAKARIETYGTLAEAKARVQADGSYVFEFILDTSDKMLAIAENGLNFVFDGDANMFGVRYPFMLRLSAKELTPSVAGDAGKAYDGTDAVPEWHSLSVALDGVVEGDDVSATADFAFAAADAGTKAVTAFGIGLSGEDAGWYTLSADAATGEAATGIVKAAQAAPEGVAAIGETSYGANDGKLTGLPAGSEWRTAGEGAWQPAPESGTVEGLAPGSYEVRMAADANHEASESVGLTVAAAPAPEPGPDPEPGPGPDDPDDQDNPDEPSGPEDPDGPDAGDGGSSAPDAGDADGDGGKTDGDSGKAEGGKGDAAGGSMGRTADAAASMAAAAGAAGLLSAAVAAFALRRRAR